MPPERPGGRWTFRLGTAAATRGLGTRLGQLLRAGDLLVLTGDLGAGKTTLTQGLGEGLGVRGPITSPTFVLARVHPSLVGGPPLVHVDAYRLGGTLELDDLDLDEAIEESVTVVEWGHGIAERLSDDRLEVVLRTTPTNSAPTSGPADPDVVLAGDDLERTATMTAAGARWATNDAQAALDALAGLSRPAG
jgi:tRNA threonylcarbamoyladenosine biosynthesis protein TsaE